MLPDHIVEVSSLSALSSFYTSLSVCDVMNQLSKNEVSGLIEFSSENSEIEVHDIHTSLSTVKYC